MIFDFFKNKKLPKNTRKIFNNACSAFDRGEYEEAVKGLLITLKIYEHSDIDKSEKDNSIVSILIMLANIQERLKQFATAEQYLTKAITLTPDNPGIYWGLSSLKLTQKEFEEAIPLLDRMISLDPLVPDGYFFRGICNQELEKYEASISDFEKVLEITPGDIDANFNLGYSYEGMNEYARAINFLDIVIYKDNTHSSAFVSRGNCKIELGQSKEGCMDYHKALELGDLKVQQNIDEYCK